MKQYAGKRKHVLLKLLLLLLLAAAGLEALLVAAGKTRLPVLFTGTATEANGWNLILVNEKYRLPEGRTAELTELDNGQCVDTRIYPALQQMFDDMRAEGVYPVVASGYRTTEKQRSLMEEERQQLLDEGMNEVNAWLEARKWVAKPGHSEHETGLAVDINADGIHSAGYEVYDWLAENAWRYGFICRYPANKENITRISAEPWHYRYVGEAAAAEMHDQDRCLEEYLKRYG